MRVYLVHGMGRSPASMLLLGRRLANAGFEPKYFGYFVSRNSLDAIAREFESFVASHEDGTTRYAIVGHSLGGVIARLAAPRLPAGFAKLVMLGPPNRSPRIARALRANPLFKVLTRDAGSRLADPAFFAGLPRTQVPTLVVAGDSFPSLPFHPHRGEATDGVVSVHETFLEGAKAMRVPAIHTFLMNDTGAVRAISRFLRDE